MKPLIFTLLSLLTLSLQAQVSSTFPDQPFTSFYNFDVKGDNIAALGSCDMLWYSTDGGVTWDFDVLETTSNYSVKFMPGMDDQVIVSQFRGMVIYDFNDGVIEDFGEEDVIVDNVNRALVTNGDDVYTFNPEGMFHLDMENMDWVNIWQDTSQNDVVHVADVTDNFIYMGMRFGRLLRYNLATQEVEHRADLGDWINRLDMYSDMGGYLISNANQMILKTLDGGTTFVELPNMTERINPVAYGENILITVNTNRIYLSEDGGESEERITTANTPEFGNIGAAKFTEDGTLYMVGHAATLVKSTDFGRTFTVVNPVLRTDFLAVAMDEDGVGLVVGEQGAVLRSTDFGASWSSTPMPFLEEEYVEDLLQIGTDEYLIISEEVYRVKDGEQVSTLAVDVDKIVLDKDGSYLLATFYDSDNTTLQKSSDLGETWVPVLDGLGGRYAIDQDNEGNIWAVTEDNMLAKSTDAGATWTEQPLTFEPYLLTFFDGNTGMLSAGNKIYQTTDGGATFEEIYSLYGLNNMTYKAADHFVFTSATQSATTLFESTDGGKTINVIFENCTVTNDLVINTEGDAVLAQRSGHINVVPLTTVTTSTIEQDQAANMVSLTPNPVSTGDQFQADIVWDKLRIHTSKGQTVQTHYAYQPSISTATLERGLYFVTMTAGSDRHTTKLIVL